MKKIIQSNILLLIVILCSSCTFLASTDKTLSYSVDDLNSIIEKYEKENQKPEKIPIGEVYAMRSVTHAHHNQKFQKSDFFLSISFVGGHGYSGLGVAGLALASIGFVIDVAALPVQAVKTLTVSDEDIRLALIDLKKARDLGYNDETIAVYYFVRHSTHLDKLGYKLEENDTPEQKNEN